MGKGRKTTLEERIEIVSYCLAHNKDYGQTMQRYRVSYYQIYGWLRKYESKGATGLLDRRGHRKDELPLSELARLSARQVHGADASDPVCAADPCGAIRLQIQSELLDTLARRRQGSMAGAL